MGVLIGLDYSMPNLLNMSSAQRVCISFMMHCLLSRTHCRRRLVAHLEFNFLDDFPLLQHGGAIGGKNEIIHIV